MKSVLISINPTWCEKIVGGEKTIEVRKTRPKMTTPFKCYIYCTFMVSTATTLSPTTAGESYTNAFMERCIGGRCVAFRPSGDGKGFCARLDNEATYEVITDG